MSRFCTGWIKTAILRCLEAAPPGQFVTHTELIDAIYSGHTDGPQNEDNALYSHISQMRAAGIPVERVTGYRLLPKR